MKPTAGILSAIVVALLGLPVLFTNGDGSTGPASSCRQVRTADGDTPVDVDAILATIRQRESGGDYQARAPGSSASGAYQFVDSTWDGHGGYPRAWMAPPAVQDAKATEHITGILDAHDGNLEAVPLVWYIGWYPGEDDPAWDTVPAPDAGNNLTPRQYRDEWIAAYQEQLNGGTGADDNHAESRSVGDDTCAPDTDAPGTVLPDGWAYPGPSDLFATAPVDAPHHDYPAWDWAIPEGTPIHAIRGGRVVSVSESPANCFDAPAAGCQPCGTGVTIEDDTRTRWTYCHGSQLNVDEDDTIPAGTHIMASGNSGRSTGPHLHLAIRTPDGTARCPQPLLTDLLNREVGVEAQDLPTTGCAY